MAVDLADERYVSLTTYKRDGSAKALPVWIVGAGGGRLAFVTSGQSWKIKRIRNDPRVSLQPSDRAGKVQPGAPTVTGTAEVTDQAEFERIRNLVASKYGFMWTLIGLISKARGLFGSSESTDTAVIITPDADPA
ncbi:MAG: PPOX class F420-dependent oxidoreductase [Actinomycetota bacterium]